MGAQVIARTRVPGWELRFAQLVRERWGMRFEWGVNDCCLWAADCVLAITGVDLMADLRGRYDSEFGSWRVLLENGGLEAMCDARLGAPTEPGLAQVGDVAMLYYEGRQLLAVCGGGHYVVVSPDGLAAIPRATAAIIKVWGVV